MAWPTTNMFLILPDLMTRLHHLPRYMQITHVSFCRSTTSHPGRTPTCRNPPRMTFYQAEPSWLQERAAHSSHKAACKRPFQRSRTKAKHQHTLPCVKSRRSHNGWRQQLLKSHDTAAAGGTCCCCCGGSSCRRRTLQSVEATRSAHQGKGGDSASPQVFIVGVFSYDIPAPACQPGRLTRKAVDYAALGQHTRDGCSQQ